MAIPALGLLASGALTAAEIRYRIGIETEPAEYDWSVDDGGISLGGADEFAYHAGIVGGAYGAAPLDAAERWSFIVGVELAVAEARDGDDGYLRWGELRVVQGVTWQCTPRWGAALVVRGGVGVDRFAFSGSAPTSAVAGSGRHDAVAIELGVDVRLTGRLHLYSGAGWRVGNHRLDDDGADTDITIRQSGPTLALGLRWQ